MQVSQILLIALVASLGLSAQAQKKTTSTDLVTAEFLGSSGQMKLFPVSAPEQFIKIKQAKLMEVKPDGTPQEGSKKSLNVAGQNQWSDFEAVTDGGRSVSSTEFTVLDGGDVSFSLTAHFAEVTSTIEERVACSGNVTAETVCTEEVTVKENEIKFSIQVEGWQFTSEENSLTYGLTISTKSIGGNDTAAVTESSEGSETISSDAGSLRTPTTATIKGGDVDAEVNVDVSLAMEGNDQVVTFVFPSFGEGKTLYYDPDVAVNQPEEDTTSSATRMGAGLVGIALFTTVNMLMH